MHAKTRLPRHRIAFPVVEEILVSVASYRAPPVRGKEQAKRPEVRGLPPEQAVVEREILAVLSEDAKEFLFVYRLGPGRRLSVRELQEF